MWTSLWSEQASMLAGWQASRLAGILEQRSGGAEDLKRRIGETEKRGDEE
jgi:hypothetical protein